MIIFRHSSFEATSKDFKNEIVDGESLLSAINRIVESNQIKEDPKEIFRTLVNGNIIESDFWEITILKVTDTVTIAPLLKGDDSNSALRSIVTIAAIAAAAYFTAPLIAAGGFSAAAGGALNAAAAVVAGLLANQLFPPPVPAGQGPYDNSSVNDSQMYSISSQQNVAKKFGSVPRVYGTHRMFPLVAAAPYTELEVDPTTGKTSQYFYCIYDFGIGPNIISDIKIGDTPITSFSEVTTRLVDFNKPVNSPELPWDSVVSDHLELYKSEQQVEAIGVQLDGNQNAGGPVASYLLERNGPQNSDAVAQQYTFNFVAAAGLYAFNAQGVRGSRIIDLDIFFSKIGEDIWRPYNDANYVSTYQATGGTVEGADTPFSFQNIAGLDPDTQAIFGLNRLFFPTDPEVVEMRNGLPFKQVEKYQIGFVPNQRDFSIPFGHGLLAGDTIVFNGTDIATVSEVNFGFYFNKDRIRLNSPFTVRYKFFDVFKYTYLQNDGGFSFGQVEYVWSGPLNPLSKKGSPLGRFTISANTQESHLASVRFTPKFPGEYKFRITRVRTRSQYTTTVQDELAVSSLITRSEKLPIFTKKRHTFLEIRIKATGQLNGTIQNLSALVTSVLNVWDGSQWALAPTNNPAWVFADILTGEINKRPIQLSQLDTDSLTQWANFCDTVPTSGALYTFVEKRYTCNFILDYNTTVQSVLSQVTGSAQASLNLINGKYGVLLDVETSTPVQIFTPRNSSGFSSQKNFNTNPDGLKVSYIDPNSNWQPNEIIVYNDGFDADTAEVFEEIQSFACTQVEQAWRFGRYFLAQHVLRQETITLKVDFEYLVCTRGDYVQITQDVMKVGGRPARVKSITGNRIVIDDAIESGPFSYGYTFRAINGSIYTSTLTIISSDTFDLDGQLPQVGDLIIIGVVGSIVYDCIVKGIVPQDDLTAVLTLVERAPELYNIESIDTIPGYEPRLSVTVDPNFSPPSEVEDLQIAANSYNILSSSYEYYMDIQWNAPANSAYEIFEVYVDDGGGFDLVSQTKNSEYRYIVPSDKLGILHTFKVLAVSVSGQKLSLGEVTGVSGTPLPKTSPPSDVLEFNSDITGEVIQLYWTKIPDLDVKEYLIRFSPAVDATWESSVIVQRVDSRTNLVAFQARVGTYLIKAIDFNNNESDNAAIIISTIPSLFNLNVIQETTDFPALTGSKDRVEKISDRLFLQRTVIGGVGIEQFNSEGYYYYQNLLDLGEIYTVRLQALIEAEGYTAADIMANWTTLSDVATLSSILSSAWDVELQYRTTNQLNVMADWSTLSSVLQISGGSEDIWTPWRKFLAGDATGRIIQFRLKLISLLPNVSPRVKDAIVRADMPDRIESYNNLSAPSTGLVVTYSPAFKGPMPSPNVQITIENGETGDYWQYVSKTPEGFEIVFFDKTNHAVARIFDAQVKGYGRKATSII